MRSQLKMYFKMGKHWLILFCIVAGLLGCQGKIFAQENSTSQGADTLNLARNPELDDLSFIEMINSVPLDGTSAELIRRFQDKEGRNRLYSKQYNGRNGSMVETYRNKEVLLITISASKLFHQNETVVREDAQEVLAPLKRYLKDPDMYRVLLVMHTDNTGSKQYREIISEQRALALFDWFVDQGCDTRYLFSYAMSDDMPLIENNSMDNRATNRRLEVYLMPGKKMLEQAKTGRIVF